MSDVASVSLADFLLARIAEDVEAASISVGDEPWMLYRVGHADTCDYPGDTPGFCTCRAVERVLAECAAKRRIVEIAGIDRFRVSEHDGLYWTLLYLALPYADHPDYDDDWRP